MTKTATLVTIVLVAAVLAGSGCVPFWVHYDCVKKNENYGEMIEGHQTEHKDLARRTEEAENKATLLEIERDKYKELWLRAEKMGKKAVEGLKEALSKGVEKAGLVTEVAGGDVKITDEGNISIAGDVLFALGSANLTAKAKTILKKLAPMLKSAEFKEAYIRVEGHTDNVPIKNPKTLEKYPTNWHLSVGRAVSVLMELKKLGVPEKKMYAAGYGEHKPRVPNAPKRKGAKENRRVEIAILKAK